MMPAQREPFEMSLQVLLQGLVELNNEVNVTGVTIDAREVHQGGVFLAVVGANLHGLSFAEQAISRDAGVIVYDPAAGGELLAQGVQENNNVKLIGLENLTEHVSEIAARFYQHPSRRKPVIGITGTNGKTSVSHFIAQALTSVNKSCGVVGTLGWGLIDKLNPTTNTTPDAVSVQGKISTLFNKGADAIAMEVSSHGLDQKRVKAVEFKGAVFTNLSHEHLDYHQTIEAYGEAKLGLFKTPSLDFVVVNRDDAFSQAIIDILPSRVNVFSYYRLASCGASSGREFVISNEKQTSQGLSFGVSFGEESAKISSSLFGCFNVDNLVATLATLVAMGFAFEKSVLAIEQIKSVTGRMQSVSLLKSGPTVIVDYAHTPDALKLALSSLREHCSGRLMVVFGCGGDRDKTKRPMMGAIAYEVADDVVITNDNPRLEAAEEIAEQIKAGISSDKDVVVSLDREQAIQQAIETADENDIVLVAGKGHEDYQIVGDKTFEFSDVACVKEALKRKVLVGTGDDGCAS